MTFRKNDKGSRVFSASLPEYWPLYRDISIVSFFINIFVLAVPIFTMNVYDRVLPTGDMPTLTVLSGGVFVVFVFDFIFRMLRSFSLDTLSSSLQEKSDMVVMQRLMQRSLGTSISVGQRLNVFQKISEVNRIWAGKVIPFMFDIPFSILFIFIIFLMSPLLSLLPLIAMGVVTCVAYISSIMSRDALGEYKKHTDERSIFLLETFGALRNLQALNGLEKRLAAWKAILDNGAAEAKTMSLWRSIVTNINFLVSILLSALVLIIGIQEVISGDLTLGALIAISILSVRALSPLSGFLDIFTDLKSHAALKHDVLKTLSDYETDYSLDQKLSDKGDLKGRIRFENLSYCYPSAADTKALDSISVDIKAQGKYAIIGANGAGKTTLAKMLARNLEPNEGKIYWDDYLIDAIAQRQQLDHVTICSQEDSFFSGTIADNVFPADKGVEDYDHPFLEKVLYACGLDVLMKSSGFGWDTPVTEGGGSLSNGQKQSLSLVRALLKDPRILVFDEPMSGMDLMVEKRLLSVLPELIKDKTFLMVTHRTSLLDLVDDVIFVENGGIKAVGPKAKILKEVAS